MLHIPEMLLLKISQMIVPHPLNSFYQLLIKIVQVDHLLLILPIDLPGVNSLELSFKIVDSFEKIHQLGVPWMALKMRIVRHGFSIFRLSDYFVYSKTLTSRMSATFATIVHILIIHMNEKLCPLVRMILVRTEVVFRLLQLCPHPRDLRLLNLRLSPR